MELDSLQANEVNKFQLHMETNTMQKITFCRNKKGKKIQMPCYGLVRKADAENCHVKDSRVTISFCNTAPLLRQQGHTS